MNYRFENERLIFEDGVTYSLDEAIVLAVDRLTDEDIQAIHLVKKIFDGEILVETHGVRLDVPVVSETIESRTLDEVAREMEGL